MVSVRQFVFGVLLASIAALSSRAGPNGGGTLLLHDAGLVYTVDLGTDLCGMGISPASCGTADTRIDGTYVPGDPPAITPKVWKVWAAFFEGSHPRLKGVDFGISYDPEQVKVLAYGPCVGDLDHGGESIPYSNWPAPNTGTSLVFQFTQTNPLVECYWFAGYAYAPSLFQLVEHPDPGFPGTFADDGVPALHDAVAGFGTLGFDMDGQAACPDPTRQGACCDLKQGTCAVVTAVECDELQSSTFEGSPSCDPNPCPTTGPCCIVKNGFCEVKTPAECENGGDLFIGLAGQTCEGDPGSSCGATPLGACCDGQTCTVTGQPDCALPALWVPLEPCYPGDRNPCLQTWGACCIGSQCYLENAETCPDLERFHPGVPCAPEGGPCVVPTRQTTWGAIKHTYR
jgi:hypothetical protein